MRRSLIILSSLLAVAAIAAIAVLFYGWIDVQGSINDLDDRVDAVDVALQPDVGTYDDTVLHREIETLRRQVIEMRTQIVDLPASAQQPTPPPTDWIVIEKQQSDMTDDKGVTKQTLTLRYSTPHGGTASWQSEVFWTENPDGSGVLEIQNEHFWDCWSNARVGEALPACARR